MTAAPRIFISYARKDGRALALRLQERLRDAGQTAWLDTSEIDGGGSWGGDIERAIDGCETLLALLSPGSYTSEICRGEQLRALRLGKRVIPVLVVPGAERPIWLETLNYRDFSPGSDFEAAFKLLLSDLDSAYTAPPVRTPPNTAPGLPNNYVLRPDMLDHVRRALLSDSTDRQIALTAVRGMGGIGKSVLAAALCHDAAVIDAFPDGVFWFDIGREPGDLVEKLRVLGKGLGDDDGAYHSREAAVGALRNLLPKKAALIVLDDVWDTAAIQPFLCNAERTRWLITTRDGKISAGLGASEVRLGTMKRPEALALLRGWAGRDDARFDEIAHLLDDHPLALKLVGARLSAGVSGAEWIDGYDSVAQIKLGRRPKDQHESIELCFDASMVSLPDDDRPLYHALGIFPEDVWVPEGMIARLWRARARLSAVDSTDLLIELERLALIERDLTQHTVRMHDLLHSYNREKIGGEAQALQGEFVTALGDPYALTPPPASALHPASQTASTPGRGGQRPADDYPWRYYAYHLLAAGQPDRLRALLLDYRWLRAKLAATDPGALIEDCEAWLTSPLNPLSVYREGTSRTDEVALTLNPSPERRVRLGEGLPEESSGLPSPSGTPRSGEGQGVRADPREPIRLLRSALGMSAHVLATDADMLPAQLHGRLYRQAAHAEIASLRAACAAAMPLFPLDNDYDALLPAGGNLLATFSGHTDWVNGALALDDGTLLSWSNDNMLRRWARDGTLLATFSGHTGGVDGALALDDGTLLSWSSDGTLRRWARDGTALATFSGHTSGVYGALVLDDGTILSWSWDETLRRWARDGTALATFSGHTGVVSGALALDDGTILSWSYDETLRRWARDGTALATFSGHTRAVSGALALDDGTLLSWSWDETLRRWARDGTALATFSGHTGWVQGALALDDGTILSWSNDKTLRRWAHDGTLLATFSGHTRGVRGALALAQADGTILSWSYDETLRRWARDGTALATFSGHTSRVSGALALAQADGTILSWSYDETLRRWARDGTALATFSGHTDRVSGALALDDGTILSWSDDNKLRRWAHDGTLLATFSGHTGRVWGALALDDGTILSWSDDETLRRWARNGTALATFSGHTYSVYGALALDDGTILSWSNDNTLRRWARDGTLLATFSGHTGGVNGALALDDGTILSWSSDKTLRRWARDGMQIAMLEENYWWGDKTRIFAWARAQGFNGNLLYPETEEPHVAGLRAARRDNTVYLYDPASGETRARWVGDANFTALAALPGGVLAAGDSVGRVVFLRVAGVGALP
jgi:WD40 repeat protein